MHIALCSSPGSSREYSRSHPPIDNWPMQIFESGQMTSGCCSWTAGSPQASLSLKKEWLKWLLCHNKTQIIPTNASMNPTTSAEFSYRTSDRQVVPSNACTQGRLQGRRTEPGSLRISPWNSDFVAFFKQFSRMLGFWWLPTSPFERSLPNVRAQETENYGTFSTPAYARMNLGPYDRRMQLCFQTRPGIEKCSLLLCCRSSTRLDAYTHL